LLAYLTCKQKVVNYKTWQSMLSITTAPITLIPSSKAFGDNETLEVQWLCIHSFSHPLIPSGGWRGQHP